MTFKQITIGFLTFGLISCNSNTKTTESKLDSTSEIKIVGAMKNVIWKGELDGVIQLDSIENKTGLYGIGPESYLSGEILIHNGQTYISRVISDSTMSVEKPINGSAPFFVYGNVTEWEEIDLPKNIVTIKDFEKYLDAKTITAKRPFAFKLVGQVENAKIHIVNLPKGNKVSSPEETHQGQTNYKLEKENAEIVGFFSTEHKGVFTHHDSFLHMHLITADESKMGHLDELEIGKMKLYLPKK